MARLNFYIVFTDLKGFSELSEELLIKYNDSINQELAKKLQPIIAQATVWNTWGDATFAAFEDGNDAVKYLLEYRAFFNYQKLSGKKLQPRMAGHYGPANVIEDPFDPKQKNLLGKHINTTARIEPITRPGEIFVSVDFKKAYEKANQTDDIRFDPLGMIKLAKNLIEFEIYRLCEDDEQEHVIDKLFVEDISDYIPEIPKLNIREQAILDELLKINIPHLFIQEIDDKNFMPEQPGMTFLYELAKHCKKLGIYDRCLNLLSKIEQSGLEVEGVQVYPYKHQPEFKKLKTNALTRLGRYKEAADIMYDLWHSGNQDTNTLCMLAAQYKRRAIYKNIKVDGIDLNEKTSIDKKLLMRASKLYTEAFRRDINDYYPAINAAYLYIIMNDENSGKGIKLATYIRQTWRKDRGQNWWIDSTLAEAEMLSGLIPTAEQEFKQAIQKASKKDSFSKFELCSTYEQIELYAKLTGKQEALKNILNLFIEHTKSD